MVSKGLSNKLSVVCFAFLTSTACSLGHVGMTTLSDTTCLPFFSQTEREFGLLDLHATLL